MQDVEKKWFVKAKGQEEREYYLYATAQHSLIEGVRLSIKV